MTAPPLVRSTVRFHVTLTGRLRVKASARVSFTEDDVREYFDLDDAEPITDALVADYVAEAEDLDLDWEIDDIDDYDHVGVEWMRREKVSIAPAFFVPLPGMEAS